MVDGAWLGFQAVGQAFTARRFESFCLHQIVVWRFQSVNTRVQVCLALSITKARKLFVHLLQSQPICGAVGGFPRNTRPLGQDSRERGTGRNPASLCGTGCEIGAGSFPVAGAQNHLRA